MGYGIMNVLGNLSQQSEDSTIKQILERFISDPGLGISGY